MAKQFTESDGVSYGFDSEADASNILTEDEYVCFSRFDDEDGRIFGIRSAEVTPPHWLNLPNKAFKYLGAY